jgi:hypothetical protein
MERSESGIQKDELPLRFGDIRWGDMAVYEAPTFKLSHDIDERCHHLMPS